jgi:hypothetical protein
MVTNVHRLNSQDLDRLISVIRQHREKLDSVRFLFYFVFILHLFFLNRIMNTFIIVYSKYFSPMFIMNEVGQLNRYPKN